MSFESEAERQQNDPVNEPAQQIALPLPLGPVYAAWLLLAINIIVYVAPWLLDAANVQVEGVPLSIYILWRGAKDNKAIWLQGEYYRFISSIFLHFGLPHIAFNSYALYSLGPTAERIYGTIRFLALYLISGLAGSVAAYLVSPQPGVGASGAIFGLIGGMAAFYYVARGILGDLSRQQISNLVMLIVINLFIGFSTPNISNEAHIGGLVGGALLGWALAPRYSLDTGHYPPVVVRQSWPLAWTATFGLLALLLTLIALVPPPL